MYPSARRSSFHLLLLCLLLSVLLRSGLVVAQVVHATEALQPPAGLSAEVLDQPADGLGWSPALHSVVHQLDASESHPPLAFEPAACLPAAAQTVAYLPCRPMPAPSVAPFRPPRAVSFRI